MLQEDHLHFLRNSLVTLTFYNEFISRLQSIELCDSGSSILVGLRIGVRRLQKQMPNLQHLPLKRYCPEMALLCYMYVLNNFYLQFFTR